MGWLLWARQQPLRCMPTGGYGSMGTTIGDGLMVWALPDK